MTDQQVASQINDYYAEQQRLGHFLNALANPIIMDTLTPPNSTPTLPRLVVCAALRHPFNGSIICGARHFDPIMRGHVLAFVGVATDRGDAQEEALAWKTADQGFVDQRGTFLTRTEAWAIASAAGQIRRRVGGDTANGGTLYSENLY